MHACASFEQSRPHTLATAPKWVVTSCVSVHAHGANLLEMKEKLRDRRLAAAKGAGLRPRGPPMALSLLQLLSAALLKRNGRMHVHHRMRAYVEQGAVVLSAQDCERTMAELRMRRTA